MVGTADFAAYFYRKSFELLAKYGCLGLIATKSISESDTRTSGLEFILSHGGIIYRAIISIPWPGEAAVIISIIHITKKIWNGEIIRNNQSVSVISSSLDENFDYESAKRLSHNRL